jgi:heavy metal sensor kinase
VSIRLRLTLWQTALLALVLAAFATLVYTAVAEQETTRLDLRLRAEAGDIQEAYQKLKQDRSKETRTSAEIADAMTAALGDDALAATLVDADGTTIASTGNLPPLLEIPPALAKHVAAGDDNPKQISVDGEPFRLFGEGIDLANGRADGAVFVVASERPMEEALAGWRWLLAGVVAVATLLAWGIGWVVTSAAMRPVDRLTQAARAIGEAGEATGRLPEPPQADELGRLARTFNWMLGRLAETSATQRRFLADASHEMRTPLTVVQTNAQGLLRRADGDPAEREESLRAILRESDRMARLINDLLTLARVDAGQRLARQTLALDELVLEVYHQERPLAEGVRLEIGAWDRAEVVGDADRLKQVLLNLVDNALRYTPTGGTVRIEVARNADAAVVRVRDTGPGIPDAERERIFERFYRVDQGRSRGDGGTGLGLAIAREVAEAHGGRIEVESKPGRGSTFSLILPLAPEVAEAPVATERLPTQRSGPVASSPSRL